MIDFEIAKVRSTDRSTIVADKVKTTGVEDTTTDYRVVLDYNVQYKKLERIIARHWPILKCDWTLEPVLPKHPRFIYRKARSLRDRLAPGVIDPPKLRIIGFSVFCWGFMRVANVLPARKPVETLRGVKNLSLMLPTKVIRFRASLHAHLWGWSICWSATAAYSMLVAPPEHYIYGWENILATSIGE